MALDNPAFRIVPEVFPYTVEEFTRQVAEVHERTKYIGPVCFALVSQVWALHTNHWVTPQLGKAEFYRIIGQAGLLLSA